MRVARQPDPHEAPSRRPSLRSVASDASGPEDEESVAVLRCHHARVAAVVPTRDGRLHTFAEGQGVVLRWSPP